MAVTLPEEGNLLLRFEAARRAGVGPELTARREAFDAMFRAMLDAEARPPAASRPRFRTIGRGLRRAAGELERLDFLVYVARADVDTIRYLDLDVDLGDETRRLRRLARELRRRGDRLDPRPNRHTIQAAGLAAFVRELGD